MQREELGLERRLWGCGRSPTSANVCLTLFPPGSVWEVRTSGRTGPHGECCGQTQWLESQEVGWVETQGCL